MYMNYLIIYSREKYCLNFGRCLKVNVSCFLQTMKNVSKFHAFSIISFVDHNSLALQSFWLISGKTEKKIKKLKNSKNNYSKSKHNAYTNSWIFGVTFISSYPISFERHLIKHLFCEAMARPW